MQKAKAKSPTVNRVLQGELCAGCGLCAGVAPAEIRMESIQPGYARPVQTEDLTPAAEAKIAGACPGAIVAPWNGAENIHPAWGPWRRVLTGSSSDAEIRFEGSSGGALSGLLVHALESGLVDRVLHIAPDPNDPTRNVTAISRTRGEIISRAGSRYTASSPLEGIDAALNEGGAMAFVGKPCDVSALRLLARRDARVMRHIPIILSFFCGGMPSHAGVGRILAAMNVPAEEVVEFRYRGRGWPGACVARTPELSAEMTYAASWGNHLSKEVQFRCKICPDAVGGVADIACADAWYGDEGGYPSFAEQAGRSLIISRTEAGDALLDTATASGKIDCQALAITEVDKMQPAQARRKRVLLARIAALPIVLQPRPRMRGLKIFEAARRVSLREAAQNMVGTFRRTLKGTRSRL